VNGQHRESLLGLPDVVPLPARATDARLLPRMPEQVAHMNGRYGDALLAIEMAKEQAWRVVEYSAALFIAVALLGFVVMLWRRA
jgi:hypothetical protein